MGTRSTIALEFADGSVSQVYCHWDGYLDHNGAILKEHYSDPFKLQQLIDQGDLSSLRPNVGEKHAFSQFELRAEEVAGYKLLTEDMCTFYARDRGEELNVRRYKDSDEYFDTCQQEEYDYILRNVDGVATWFVRCYATDGVWATIPEAYALQEKMEKEGVY
jgi:hypothetical protein